MTSQGLIHLGQHWLRQSQLFFTFFWKFYFDKHTQWSVMHIITQHLHWVVAHKSWWTVCYLFELTPSCCTHEVSWNIASCCHSNNSIQVKPLTDDSLCIWDPHFINTVPADVLAPNGARTSPDTVLIASISLSFFLPIPFSYHPWWPHDVIPWWCHQMETFSALLVLCARNQWIPHTKASDAELWCLLWSAPEQTVE